MRKNENILSIRRNGGKVKMEITLNVHVSGLEGLAEALKALTRPIEYAEPASPAKAGV